MSDSNHPQSDHSANHLGPGDRLQAARISIGLTLEDVASKMHLSTSILSNLEENKFSEITAPIFVKGYLRSYARIVNLDEHEIIDQYASFANDGDPPISSTSNTPPEINANDTRVKTTTWLIIVAMVGLLSIWWWNRYQQPTETVSLDSGTVVQNVDPVSVDTAPVNDLETEVVESTVESPSLGTTILTPTDPTTVADDSGSAPDPQAMQALEEAASSSIDAAAIEAEPVRVEPQAIVEPEPLTEAEPAASADPEAPLPVPADSQALVIEVSADTWTDIRDADGNRLVYDLLRSGERLELDGKPPFRAFLGNAYGVSISYQGEAVDISGLIRDDNTARVNIGQ